MILNVAPYKYHVTQDAHTIAKSSKDNGFDSTNLGMCLHPQARVLLDDDQAPTMLQETAHHEWLHIAWYQTGLGEFYSVEDEERIVTTLSPVILANLRANPEFLAKLLEETE